MPHVRRLRISPSEKAAFWARWKRGESFRTIADALGWRPDTLYRVAARHGGIAPPVRRRAARTLRVQEREEISRALATGAALRAIARTLARAPSTISREVRRHGGRASYRAAEADARAWQAAGRPKRCRLALQPRLCAVVATKLAADWSPEPIAGWLKVTYAANASRGISCW